MGCPEDAETHLPVMFPAFRLAFKPREVASGAAPEAVSLPPRAESNLVCTHQSVCALNLDTNASKHRVSLSPL
jgi:hypothetical protein